MSNKSYQESKNRYIKEKTDEIKLYVPKGEKAFIQAAAKAAGKSVNAFIYDLIQERIGN